MKIIAIMIFLFSLGIAAHDLWAGPDQDLWADFDFPEIDFVDQDDNSTVGAKIFNRLVPEPEHFVENICKHVARVLYKDANDVPTINKINFYIEEYDGISAKSGGPPEISIKLSTTYIEKYYNDNKQSVSLMESEILGILLHEITHGYQNVPQNCGEYKMGTERFGFIEGLADGVRIRAGYHQSRSPNSSSRKWRAGYTTTGFFYNWIADNYDPDFMAKLNGSCKTIDPWSFEEAVRQILQKSADELWSEYEDNLDNIDSQPVKNVISI